MHHALLVGERAANVEQVQGVELGGGGFGHLVGSRCGEPHMINHGCRGPDYGLAPDDDGYLANGAPRFYLPVSLRDVFQSEAVADVRSQQSAVNQVGYRGEDISRTLRLDFVSRGHAHEFVVNGDVPVEQPPAPVTGVGSENRDDLT